MNKYVKFTLVFISIWTIVCAKNKYTVNNSIRLISFHNKAAEKKTQINGSHLDFAR